MYELIKALHIIAVVCWFAGLFYLPRLFVYHVKAADNAHSDALLQVMEFKLYRYITTPAMVATWLLGGAMIVLNPALLSGGWLHAKLLLVVVLSGYHGSLGVLRKKFAAGQNTRSEKFFRWYNEIPTLVLVAVVFLVVMKPF